MNRDVEQILREYDSAYRWLLGLIQDPSGKVETRELGRDERLVEFRERLANMQAFLAFANNPEADFRSVHVTGTSGKGSVTVMISALLSACGQRTGDHTSPFLQLPAEKLRVDGRMIAPSEFGHLIGQLRELIERWRAQGNMLRYGQAWAALTFLWFKYAQVNWGVYETSMGGRFSNSNLLPAEIAVITNVDYDHVKALGPSLESIAWHKAGIIRHNKPAVTAETKPHILDILRREAAEKNAALYKIDWHLDVDDKLVVQTPLREIVANRPNLHGKFQFINAATAITTVDILAHQHGFELTEQAIEQAFNNLVYAGRFEVIQERPTVILDGAHNPAKMRAFVESVQQAYPNRRATIMIGKLATKDGREMLEALRPIAARFVASQPHVYGKMPTPATVLAEKLREVAPDVPVAVNADILAAVEETLSGLAEEDIFIITGSIYLVGEARGYWYPARPMLEALERLAEHPLKPI